MNMTENLNQEMQHSLMSELWKRRGVILQLLLVFIVWFFLCWLHWDNDGLWYPDAPCHAANGIFWKDYLLKLSFDPISYTLSYHARYPVINPTKYPPAFYLLEAVFFGLFSPSPYIAKGLVLGFALMAALYTTMLSRRWISQEAGWAGVLLILLPGVVLWSHAIMLNIPALALSIGSLYHLRRWIESPTTSPAWKNLYVGAAMAVLSIMTYITSGVLLLIAGIWLIVERRWRLLWHLRTLAVFIVSALLLLPWAILVLKYEPNRVVMATGSADYITAVSYWHWKYYLESLPGLFGLHIIFIAAIGVVGGMLFRRWRHETILLLIMTLVLFIFFSYVPSREDRYILLMSMPIAIFCLLGLISITHLIGNLTKLRPEREKAVTLAVISVFLIGQIWQVLKVPVYSISGYKQLVEYIETIAPDESVFYDGENYQIFTFYVQSGDPGYHRRVVVGNKLLYAESWFHGPQEFVKSAQDVVDILQKQGGCQLVVVADEPAALKIEAPRHLRKAVKGPEFELVKSQPITKIQESGVEETNVCVYRLLVPVEEVEEVNMPFFGRGENLRHRSKPILR
jgi:4-amino-4-deoxy-L-arabinose transferase-like glycosyltransferase